MPRGERVGDAYVKIHADGDDVPGDIRDSLGDADGDVKAAGERHGKDYREGFNPDEFSRLLKKLWKDDVPAQEAGERQSRIYLDHWNAKDFQARMRALWSSTDKDVRRFGVRSADEYHRGFFSRSRRFISGLDDLFDVASTRVGRSLGRGSRNDFLNFIGVLAEGVTRLSYNILKIPFDVVTKLGKSFEDAGGGLDGLLNMFKAGGGLIAGAAASLAVFAAGLGVFLLVLGPVVAGLSGLLGILIALSSTVVFAAIAALAALAGALVPIGAAIGVIVLGLTNLDDSQIDKLREATRGLRREFSDLGSDVGHILTDDIEPQANQLRDVVASFHRPIEAIASAVRGVANEWVDLLDSPGVEGFANFLGRRLPGMIETLGRIAANSLGGIGGLFVGATPLIRRFLGWLEQITDNFSEWANSKDGRQEVRDFLDRAADSAESLGGFLGSVWDLLVLILDKGNTTGNTIFDDMADAIGRFTDHLAKNPDALEDFFDNAEDVAGDLGDLIETIGRLLDYLDSPTNRQILQDFADALRIVGPALVWPIVQMNTFVGILKAIWTWADKVGDKINDAFRAVGRFLGKLGLGGKGGGGLGTPMVLDIKLPDLAKILAGLSGWPAKILDKIGVIDLMKNVKRIDVGKILGWFAGMAGKILGKVGDIVLQKNIRPPDMPRILGWFAGTAGRILDRVGIIDLNDNVHVNIPSIVGMFSGLNSAIQRAIGTVTVPVTYTTPSERRGGGGGGSGNGFASGTAGTGSDGPGGVVPKSGVSIGQFNSYGADGQTVLNELEARILAGAYA